VAFCKFLKVQLTECQVELHQDVSEKEALIAVLAEQSHFGVFLHIKAGRMEASRFFCVFGDGKDARVQTFLQRVSEEIVKWQAESH